MGVITILIDDLLRLLLVLLVILVVSQIIVALMITISYKIRTRRKLPPEKFPHIDMPPIPLGDSGAEIEIYSEGVELFDHMLTAIQNAKETIYFESYIWKSDVLGEKFKEAVIAKAREGVQVLLIYDAFGNLVVPRKFKKYPDDLENLHVLPFWRPQGLIQYLWIGNFKFDHRKILVTDNEVAFVGGYNIGELYRTEWRDTHMRVTGEYVHNLAHSFVKFWNHHRRDRPEIVEPSPPWKGNFRVHRNNPNQKNYPIRSMYLHAIEHAQEYIRFTNAYFVPDPSIRQAIIDAAKRGVRVEILVPWQSNHVIADWLGRHSFDKYLEAGCRLYGYDGEMIHSKTATVDGIWTTIGTANLDQLSLTWNHEINVEIFDSGVAEQMDQIFEKDLTNSHEIMLEEWNSRPRHSKIGEWILSPLWPFI